MKKNENSVTGAKLRLSGKAHKASIQQAKLDRPSGPRQVSGAARPGASIVQASRKRVERGSKEGWWSIWSLTLWKRKCHHATKATKEKKRIAKYFVAFQVPTQEEFQKYIRKGVGNTSCSARHALTQALRSESRGLSFCNFLLRSAFPDASFREVTTWRPAWLESNVDVQYRRRAASLGRHQR